MKSILLLRFVSDRLRDEAKSYIQLDFPQCEISTSRTTIFFNLKITADSQETLTQVLDSIIRDCSLDIAEAID